MPEQYVATKKIPVTNDWRSIPRGTILDKDLTILSLPDHYLKTVLGAKSFLGKKVTLGETAASFLEKTTTCFYELTKDRTIDWHLSAVVLPKGTFLELVNKRERTLKIKVLPDKFKEDRILQLLSEDLIVFSREGFKALKKLGS